MKKNRLEYILFSSVFFILLFIGVIFDLYTGRYAWQSYLFLNILHFVIGLFLFLLLFESVFLLIKKRKIIPRTAYFYLIFLVIVLSIKGMGIILLNNSNKPYINTRALILNHQPFIREFDNEIKLQFIDNSNGKNKIVIVNQNIISNFWFLSKKIKDNDCVQIKYRKNAIVIEIAKMKILGKKEKCLTM